MISHIFNNTTAHIKAVQVTTGFDRLTAVAFATITASDPVQYVGAACYTSMPANLKDSTSVLAWENVNEVSFLIEQTRLFKELTPGKVWQFCWGLSSAGADDLAYRLAQTELPSSSTIYIRYTMSTATTTYYIWASLTYTLSPAAGVTFEHTWL